MNMKIHGAFILGALLVSAGGGCFLRAGQETPLTVAERTLANLINQVRLDNGRPAVVVTVSLTKVARLHIGDLNANRPDTGEDDRGEDCNMHSWSNLGTWQPVCYTDDHYYSALMWSKPRELTSYPANGYEIANFYSQGVTPKSAMASWQGSPDHLDVILEQSVFSGHSWKAMGVGISGNYACVWFGEIEDPAGSVPVGSATAEKQIQSTDYSDQAGYAGGLAMSIPKTIVRGSAPVRFVLGLNGRNTADLRDCRYTIQIFSGGTWQRYFRSKKSFFTNLSLSPGQTKKWIWDRRHDEGMPEAGPGKYRVRFRAPHYTSDILVVEFEIRG
jgi:hypothetical protein